MPSLQVILDAEAREAGFSPPAPRAVETAAGLIRKLREAVPGIVFDVYPTDDREVAIDVHARYRRAALLLCEPGGAVVVFVTCDGQNARRRYPDAMTLPDTFTLDAVRSLAEDAPGGAGTEKKEEDQKP